MSHTRGMNSARNFNENKIKKVEAYDPLRTFFKALSYRSGAAIKVNFFVRLYTCFQFKTSLGGYFFFMKFYIGGF